MPKAPAYIYEKLTWSQINEAVVAGKVPIIPVGSIEQHGPHLPLDVDCVLPRGVAMHAAEQIPDQVLILPTLVVGYTAHVMDFPGTLNLHYSHFIDMIIDVGKSLAYHGFKKMIFLNGHGSNMPNLDLAVRRINLETDAEAAFCAWWRLLTVDKDFPPNWRESAFPGGCNHACELETSAYLYLDPEHVRQELAENSLPRYIEEGSEFLWFDLFGDGPVHMNTWTSSYTKTGAFGSSALGTAEKGEAAVKEAARQLARFVAEFAKRPKDGRVDHHAVRPTFEMPWGQGPAPSEG